MIDRTFDPLPKRARPGDRAHRHGGTWFSSDTIYRAQHYADLSWFRLAVPALVALAFVFVAHVWLNGDAAVLAYCLATIAAVMGVHGLASKALLGFHVPEK